MVAPRSRRRMIASIHDRDMASASYPRRGTQGDAYEILMSMCATSVEPAIAQVNLSLIHIFLSQPLPNVGGGACLAAWLTRQMVHLNSRRAMRPHNQWRSRLLRACANR